MGGRGGRLHELIAGHASDPAEVVVGIETDRGLLVGALVAAGYQVIAVNPLAASRYRERHTISRAKSDPAWPQLYQQEAARIRWVLGDRVMRLEHVGSTSVPGLPAKPIVDLVLEVPDAADEAAYLPAMAAAGYVLRLREPHWHQHRLFKGPDADINLHVFSAASPETDRMVRFRDRLRADPADRELYLDTKRELAARDWTYVQQYADAKTAVIGEILTRAQGTEEAS
jgi:GrpB-like predicted nucleotidyltransferase (UPF0157 family)